MSSKQFITFGAVAAAMAVVLLFRPLAKGEPRHNNRALTSWLIQLDDGKREHGLTVVWEPWGVERSAAQAEAAEAIRQMGTNTLPYLLHLLRADESFIGARVRLLRGKPPGYPAWRRRATLALDALGPLAKPALPELKDMLYSGPANKEAATALAAIAPEGWAVLSEAVPSSNTWAAMCSIWALGSHRASVPGTVPALVALVRNNPSGEGSVSAWALGQIAKGPDEVIPVLITGLQSPDGGLRRGCADALGRFGQQAQSAAPALLGALQDNDPAVSRAAAESLTQINSEAPKQGEEK